MQGLQEKAVKASSKPSQTKYYEVTTAKRGAGDVKFEDNNFTRSDPAAGDGEQPPGESRTGEAVGY
eukprot:CAMPEP_0206435394 /NCGR_PEP_ID=MMETSP0324_2-20121206/9822_1 /ASSEMBLY_ACC=CAM_ASM_000836 /TAXON_ID=2866 /ORGANISM="Crypthecodinium cohnii, Strain Seligo" /LENGTH=65 /DNA_ID=CAMNT_0053902281 /DNA_START=804 /DNA_END=999 /DNA_ORIENTATION=-